MSLEILSVIALTSAALALLAGAIALMATRAAGRLRAAQQRLELRLAHAEKQLKRASHGAIGLGQRVLALEEKLQQLQSRAGDGDLDERFNYSDAMQLFEQGLDAHTVAASCGLSSSEAGLMEMLYRHKNPHAA